MSAKRMFPPSSGENGQEVEERDRHADQPEQQQVPLDPDLEELGRRADDPTGPEIWAAPWCPSEEVPEDWPPCR